MPLLNRNAVLEIEDRGTSVSLNTRINFDITKDNFPYSNKGAINVYNLSKNSQSLIESETANYNLKTGYIDQAPISLFICQRDIRNGIHTERSGPDVITKLECGDSEAAIQKIISLSYNGAVNAQDIITRCIESLSENGVSIGYISDNINYKIINNGFTAFSSILQVLDQMANLCNFEWSIQDREIFILNRNETIPRGTTLGSGEGLEGFVIGSVIKSETKVEFKCWLNTDLKIGAPIVLKSEVVGEVNLKLLRVQHVGDSWEGPWESRCEGLLL